MYMNKYVPKKFPITKKLGIDLALNVLNRPSKYATYIAITSCCINQTIQFTFFSSFLSSISFGENE